MESLVGGRGGDRLTGDGDDNNLEGGPGNDVLRGRGGRDIPLGGRGNDRSYGDAGDDVVWGDEGRDRLFGGTGDDFLISLEEQGPAFADVLACGRGADDARSDSRDTLTGACEEVVAFSNGFSVGSLPGIDTDSADFELTCFGGSVEGCHGTIRLTGPGGADFGSAQFDVATDAVDVPVSVPLSAAAVAALERGTIVTVDLVPDAPSDLEEPGGYRASMVVGQAAQPPSSPSSSSSVAGSGSSATAAHGSHASSAWRS
jgi:Ca2+-binding RTX toxin-like protein